MRILLAVSEYHRGGGFPRHGVNLAHALARRAHQVTVLTRRAELLEEDRALTFRFYRCLHRTTAMVLATEPWALTRAVRRMGREFDAVVSLGIPLLAPAVLVGPGTQRGYFLATRASLPRWSVRRAFETVRPFHRIVMAWERAMLRRGHATLAVVGAERYGREYTDIYGLPPERVAVIPHGVELREFAFDPAARERTRAELGADPGTLLLLNVAGRARQKGLDVLGDALRLLPRDIDWRFAFAGDGSLSRALRRRVADLVRQGRVLLLGRVHDVRRLYSAADLLVFPSRYDPWGMVVTEALACGLPVLCSGATGSATAMRPGENGELLEDPTDVRELAAKMAALLARPFDRARVAASVRHLTWDRCAEGIEQRLRDLGPAPGAVPDPAQPAEATGGGR